jgi:hypothetical protein
VAAILFGKRASTLISWSLPAAIGLRTGCRGRDEDESPCRDPAS